MNRPADVVTFLADRYHFPIPKLGELVDTPLCKGTIIWKERDFDVLLGAGWRLGIQLPSWFVPSGTLD